MLPQHHQAMRITREGQAAPAAMIRHEDLAIVIREGFKPFQGCLLDLSGIIEFGRENHKIRELGGWLSQTRRWRALKVGRGVLEHCIEWKGHTERLGVERRERQARSGSRGELQEKCTTALSNLKNPTHPRHQGLWAKSCPLSRSTSLLRRSRRRIWERVSMPADRPNSGKCKFLLFRTCLTMPVTDSRSPAARDISFDESAFTSFRKDPRRVDVRFPAGVYCRSPQRRTTRRIA